MPTLTRQPDVPVTAMPGGIATGHGGDSVQVGAPASPPGELLPSGGPDRFEVWSGRASSARGMRLPPRVRRPARTSRPGLAFERRVRAIHRQLLPLQSRAALASSYQREAARWSDRSDLLEPVRASTALHVAYALRWLELSEG